MGLFVVLAAIAGRPASAAPNELGHPVLRDFPPGRSKIGPLCQDATQDPAGFIYIANGPLVRFYDGANWPVIPLPTESAGARKFAVTADGTIYLGGASVIGYLRGAGPDCKFVSLADRLPPTATGYDDIFDVLAVGHAVYFADEEKILIWRDGHFTVVPCRTPAYSHGSRLHRVGDAVYVTAPDRPLCRLANDRLEAVSDDPIFRQTRIIFIEAGPAGDLVLLTADRGFFQLGADGVRPLALEANRWLAGKTILCARRLGDGSSVVAFTSPSGDGGMRFDAAGRYLGPIDQSVGLYVNTLRSFFCDREGGLWIASETGMFRLEWPSPVTVFDIVNGLGQGAVADVARHEGALYAATAEGVYRLTASDDRDGRCAHFERVLNYPASALLSHPGGLLALGYTDVFAQTAAGFAPVAKLPPGGASLQRSPHDPDRVLIGTGHGLQSIRHTAAGWRDEGPVRDAAEFFPEKPAAPDGARIPLPPWVNDSAGAIARMRVENGSAGEVLWVCGAKGLVRVDLARGFSAPVPFAVLLTTTGVHERDRLAPEHTALKFDFVALRHQLADSVTYQTRLVGQNREWSPWSHSRQSVFTSLPAGSYRFEVRARDADGQFAAPAAVAFVVLPPWWRTWWALLGYAGAGAGVVAGAVRLRTRALRQRAERLQALVDDRTAELARKNTELVRLHQLELDEKISARLAEEKARLEVLRYQLNPHFLFNTLASISAALPAGRSTPRTMVERLAEFCRLTLHRPDERDWTTLGEELKLLRAYLEIELSRWGDLLDVEISADPALDRERLPHFLLLPLVENALKYGRATSPDRVGLRLAARRDRDGALVLEVANTGEWVEPAEKKRVASLGIGLDNLRERLARYYPRSHTFAVAHANGWVTATLRLTVPPAGTR